MSLAIVYKHVYADDCNVLHDYNVFMLPLQYITIMQLCYGI